MGEIIALVKKGQLPRGGESIGEGISEIKAGRVSSFAVAMISGYGCPKLLIVQLNQLYERTFQELNGGLENIVSFSHSDNHKFNSGSNGNQDFAIVDHQAIERLAFRLNHQYGHYG